MDMGLLNMAMRSEARSLGLCDQWFSGWSDDCGVDELLDMYVKGIDFCIQHDYPKNDVLKKYGGESLERHGIYVDENLGEKENAPSVIILNGSCKGSVSYGDMRIASIYVRHDSDITVNVSDMAQAFIEVYDNAKVRVVNTGEKRCFVYKHGGDIEVRGDVLVRDRT